MGLLPSKNIRKAVSLADGWSIYDGKYANLSDDMAETVDGYRFYLTDQILLDYLAAQLCRQVECNKKYSVAVLMMRTVISSTDDDRYQHLLDDLCGYSEPIGDASGPDRTDNTINAIVESGVLE